MLGNNYLYYYYYITLHGKFMQPFQIFFATRSSLHLRRDKSVTSVEMGELPSEVPYSFPSWWFLTNPSEKYARQNGNLPRIVVKMKQIYI